MIMIITVVIIMVIIMIMMIILIIIIIIIIIIMICTQKPKPGSGGQSQPKGPSAVAAFGDNRPGAQSGEGNKNINRQEANKLKEHAKPDEEISDKHNKNLVGRGKDSRRAARKEPEDSQKSLQKPTTET